MTDSTAAFGPAAEQDGVPAVTVVPLHLVVGDASWREGVDLSDDDAVAHVVAGERVSTTQPSPQAFADVYEQAAARGAREVVSVHLSGELSGTVHTAAVAARTAPVPVHVIDSGTSGAALGMGVVAAQRALGEGATALVAAQRAVAVCRSSGVAFLVDSLEHLRRGGRLGRTASTVGTLLGVRPVLEVRSGRIELAQVARSRRGAEVRLERFVTERAARAARPQVAVHWFDDRSAADALAGRLGERLDMDVEVLRVSTVLGAHVGPGLLGVVVADTAAG